MPENPPPVPPDDPCFPTVAAYNDYVATHIDAFLHAARHQKFAAYFEPLTQCCGELRSKVDGFRPADPDAEALRTFTIPTAVFDRQSACGQHPYFQDPAGGGLSPAHRWLQEQKQSRSDFWLQQYTDLSAELHGCCERHLSQCLLKGPELRSCIEGLLPPPPAVLSAADSPETAAPAVSPLAAPVAGETQTATLFQRGYEYLGKLESVELPVGLWILVILAGGAGVGWLLGQIGWWVYAEAAPTLFQLIRDAVLFPLRSYRRRGAAGEALPPAGETPAERPAPDPLFY